MRKARTVAKRCVLWLWFILSLVFLVPMAMIFFLGIVVEGSGSAMRDGASEAFEFAKGEFRRLERWCKDDL